MCHTKAYRGGQPPAAQPQQGEDREDAHGVDHGDAGLITIIIIIIITPIMH